MKDPVHYAFTSIIDRDKFLEITYPRRKVTHIPGFYKVPGGHVGVRLEEITFYPDDEKEAT